MTSVPSSRVMTEPRVPVVGAAGEEEAEGADPEAVPLAVPDGRLDEPDPAPELPVLESEVLLLLLRVNLLCQPLHMLVLYTRLTQHQDQ